MGGLGAVDRVIDLLREAAHGRFPPGDGEVELVPRPPGPVLASDAEGDRPAAPKGLGVRVEERSLLGGFDPLPGGPVGRAGVQPPAAQLMELNREASGLEQEQASGRFTLTRYILYLLPVIGFIGTVEGISKALMNISKVLPMVKDLDGFMNNLTGVTSALQIAFDSTLLALFLSAALMLVQTLVYRRAEDLLGVGRHETINGSPKVC